jgi:hypothetical protein
MASTTSASDILFIGMGALCVVFGLAFVIVPTQEISVRPRSHGRGNFNQAISRLEALLDALIKLLLLSGGVVLLYQAGYPPTWLGITKCA